MKRLPKLILTDIDGVWTDGGMYYHEFPDGSVGEIKKFNTSDSAGIIFSKLCNIKIGIITGENTKLLEARSKKLEVDYLFQGVNNKLEKISDFIKSKKINFCDVAYIGDDINDISLLQNCGFSACPKDAPTYVKSEVDLVLGKNGGEGVFREFVEHILSEFGLLEITVKKFINNG